MPISSLEKIPATLLQADNLPSLPAVAVEVLRLTQDEDATIDDLARTLSRDPALAAKLLKLSNSSLFNPGYAVTTLQRATMVLGMKTVKLMALSFSLASSLPKESSGEGFDLDAYWRRSLVNAVASRALGDHVQVPIGDEAFLCGLLGHIGRMVMAQCLPAGEYAELVTNAGGWPSSADEEAQLGFSSRDVTYALLKTWELPEDISVPIYYREEPESLAADATDTAQSLTRVLDTALAIEGLLCRGEFPEGGEARAKAAMALLEDKAKTYYGFTEERLDEFLVGLEAGIAETAEMLNIKLRAGTTHQDIINEARQQIVAVSMGLGAELNQANRRSQELEGRNRELATEANTDKLTGLPNRKHFDEFLERQIDDRRHGEVPLSMGLIMIDVDRFKSFNDTHGHQAGDEVLRMVGTVLANTTRKGDLPARYGGEEFAVILPQTKPFALRAAAERLRKEIEKASVDFEGKVLKVTASFGGACISETKGEDDGRRLVKLADHYLYKAKENGRNRSEISSRIVKLPRS